MAVSTDLAEVTYTGNGTKTTDVTPSAYVITFPVLYNEYGNAEDINVFVYIKATGALAADETLTATVSGLNVTTALAWDSTYWVSLVRIPAFLQEQAFNYKSALPSSVVEYALDKQVMMLQYLKAKMPMLPSTASNRANAFAAYDASGNLTFTDTAITGMAAVAGGPIAEMLDDVNNLAGQKTLGLIPAAASAAISAPVQSLLDDATLAAFRTTLDVYNKAESAALGPKLKAGDLEGCILSNDAGDVEHDINITAGRRLDSTGTKDIVLAAEITKQINAAWAAGDDAGGIDTGAVGNTTTYWLYLIASADGTTLVDAIFSAAAPATGPALPAGYTLFRALEAFRTDGSANLPLFDQKQGWVYFKARPAELAVGAIANTNRNLLTMTYTPENSEARLNIKSNGASAGPYYAWVRDTAATDAAASLANSNATGMTGIPTMNNEIQLYVDASRQIAYRGDNTNLSLGVFAVAYKSDVGAFDYP